MPPDGKGWKPATPNKGGPPPLPAKGSPQDLKKGADAACKAKGVPGGGAPACNWELHIKVYSQEKFWPRDPFDVQFGAVKPVIGGAKTLVPPIPAHWYKSSVQRKSATSPEIVFKDSGPKKGGVTAAVHTLKKETDWVLVQGAGSTNLQADQYVAESIDNGQNHKLDLYIRHPLKVYLEFKFKDPEKKVFPFPKDFPVQVWNNDKVLEQKTDKKGRVAFELD